MSNHNDAPQLLRWRGTKIYRCRLCAFDTPDKARFEDHFRKTHAPFQVIEGRKEDPQRMNREELNAYAGRYGVQDAANTNLYPTKADLIAAIEAAQKGED